MIYVLDAGPMIAYLRAETGADVVQAILQDQDSICVAHVVNMLEIYYDFIRAANEPTASQAIRTLQDDGVSIRRDLSVEFWKDVGQLKAKHSIALADCFGLALARKLGAEFITTDHRELDALVPLGVCAIRFIR